MTEEQTWSKMLKGDMAALESIYRSYVGILFDYGFKISHNKEITEDCIQNLFSELWIKRNNLNPTHNVKAYLMLSLRRRLYRSIQRSNKLTTLEESHHRFILEPDEEEKHITTESREFELIKLKKALESLSNQQREILFLRFEHNLPSKAIAELLNMKDQSVRNTLHRAISKLREVLFFSILLSTISMVLYLILK